MLYNLLSQPAYKAEPIIKAYDPKFESLHDYGDIITLFDDLQHQLGRIPSQQEYVQAGMGRAEDFFNNSQPLYIYKTREHHQFNWDDKLKKAVTYRLARTYTSYLIEEQVKEYLTSRGFIIYYNQLIDMNLGVDIVVQNQNRLSYIHITKNTPMSAKQLAEKANRRSYVMVGNKKEYYNRAWGLGHSLLLYNDINSDRMQLINDNLLFSDDYLAIYFHKLFNEVSYQLLDGTSELEQFVEFTHRAGKPLVIHKGDN